VEKSGNILDRPSAEQRDQLLWERTARKDEASFCELFDRRAPAILGVLCKLLSRSEAEEVLQEVFRDVWKEAASFSPNGTSPFAWILLRARARACDRLRSRNTR
jgi:RNA polymerase sigma-70 factor (ECF subfamily)